MIVKEQYKLDNLLLYSWYYSLSLTLLFGYKYLDLHQKNMYEKFQ
jgi:hypothetical protein